MLSVCSWCRLALEQSQRNTEEIRTNANWLSAKQSVSQSRIGFPQSSGSFLHESEFGDSMDAYWLTPPNPSQRLVVWAPCAERDKNAKEAPSQRFYNQVWFPTFLRRLSFRTDIWNFGCLTDCGHIPSTLGRRKTWWIQKSNTERRNQSQTPKMPLNPWNLAFPSAGENEFPSKLLADVVAFRTILILVWVWISVPFSKNRPRQLILESRLIFEPSAGCQRALCRKRATGSHPALPKVLQPGDFSSFTFLHYDVHPMQLSLWFEQILTSWLLYWPTRLMQIVSRVRCTSFSTRSLEFEQSSLSWDVRNFCYARQRRGRSSQSTICSETLKL